MEKVVIELEHIKCFDVRKREMIVEDKNFTIANCIHAEGSVRVYGLGAELYETGKAEITREQAAEIAQIIDQSPNVVAALKRATTEYIKNLF